MSQITSCPSCGTRFRVVADQLRISDGWVRCGQCQEVFDARQHLDAPAPVPGVPLPAAPGRLSAAPAPAPAPAPAASVRADPVAAVSQAAGAFRPELKPASVPEPPSASAPGYELPAPQLADDIDFTGYQPAGGEKPAPAWSAPTPARPVPDPATAVVPEVKHVRAPESLPEPVRPTAVPAWSAAARAPARDAAFPPLDLSVLQLHGDPDMPGPVTPPEPVKEPHAAPVALPPEPVLDESALKRLPQMHGQLSKEEPSGAFDALPAWPVLNPLPGQQQPAPVGAEAETPGPENLPDALESAAQKLAHTEAATPPPAVPVWADTGAEHPDHSGPDSSLEPGFVREARRKAWWQKPGVRVAMGAAVVVLPVALALQVALHERNALVAWQPGTRPVFEFMCTALQCTLGPRQQIAAMVVSGSAFAKGTADRSYQLSLSIQNRARTPVGMPAVELTLTDAQDQAIARKVLSAKELGAPAELKAGSEWSTAVPVTTEGLNLQVVGYRVLLFYP